MKFTLVMTARVITRVPEGLRVREVLPQGTK